MARGVSLHIGLNQIDPAHYGTTGNLRGCENDAKAMQSIAATYGYDSTLLLTRQATSGNVLRELSRAAERLDPGDTLMLTYAGHGSQVRDTTSDEQDAMDETWCLYDRMLIDDELNEYWGQLKPGVRVILVSDSCHSGTILRFYQQQRKLISPLLHPYSLLFDDDRDLEEPAYRVLPPDITVQAFSKFYDQYQDIKASLPRGERSTVTSSVLLLSACQDNQTASDGANNGLFTATLLSVWNRGTFSGNYRAFYNRIINVMPPTQSPNYDTTGIASSAFEQESPFTISGRADVPAPSTGVGTSQPARPALSADERLAQLKEAYKKRQRDLIAPGNGGSRCKFSIDVDRNIVAAMTDNELYQFLQTDGCGVLMKAYEQARAVAPTRGGGEVTFDCKVNDHQAKCEGGISIRL